MLFGLLYFPLLYAAWFWFRIGRINWRGHRAWLGLAVILVIGDCVVWGLRHHHFNENSGLWWGGDVSAYLMPPATSRFLYRPGRHGSPQCRVFLTPGSLENTVFIGYALPLLALVLWALRLARRRELSARFRRRSGAARWPGCWLVFLMLTVPTLRIYGHDGLNLPTALLHFIPFFNNIRCPTRWR